MLTYSQIVLQSDVLERTRHTDFMQSLVNGALMEDTMVSFHHQQESSQCTIRVVADGKTLFLWLVFAEWQVASDGSVQIVQVQAEGNL